MKSPTSREIENSGWIAAAHDGDGNLCALLAWMDGASTSDNLEELAAFLDENTGPDGNRKITIYPDNFGIANVSGPAD